MLWMSSKKKQQKNMNLLGGVGSEERLDSTLVESFKNRIPWLIVNLFTANYGFKCCLVFLKEQLRKLLLLQRLVRLLQEWVVNAGTQTLTIVVRGLSLGELDKENARQSFN